MSLNSTKPLPLTLAKVHETIATLSTSASTLGSTKADKTGVLALVAAPASATATGVAGQVAYDATAIYVCVATNTWVKATLATWA